MFSPSVSASFTQFILQNDAIDAIKLGLDMLASGQHENFWINCFSVMVEYVHLFLPNCPNFIFKKFNEFNTLFKSHNYKITSVEQYKPIIIPVVNLLCNNYKQHLSLYIPDKYNVIEKSNSGKVRDLFRDLNGILTKLTEWKQKNQEKIANQTQVNKLFEIVGKILSVDCDSLTNFYTQNHNKINLFTHTHSQIHPKIAHILWSILLSQAKQLDAKSYANCESLAKLYHTRLLDKIEQSSFIILNVCCYFVYVYDFTIRPKTILMCQKKQAQPSAKNEAIAHRQDYENMKQRILNDVDEDTKEDIFHMRKIYQLFGINYIGGDDDETDSRLSLRNANEQKKLVQQSLFDFQGLHRSDYETRVLSSSDKSYKFVEDTGKSSLFSGKCSQFKIIKS